MLSKSLRHLLKHFMRKKSEKKFELERIEREKHHLAHQEKLRREAQEQERLHSLIEAARKHKVANDIRALTEAVICSNSDLI